MTWLFGPLSAFFTLSDANSLQVGIGCLYVVTLLTIAYAGLRP